MRTFTSTSRFWRCESLASLLAVFGLEPLVEAARVVRSGAPLRQNRIAATATGIPGPKRVIYGGFIGLPREEGRSVRRSCATPKISSLLACRRNANSRHSTLNMPTISRSPKCWCFRSAVGLSAIIARSCENLR